jgi:hypothetical protein
MGHRPFCWLAPLRRGWLTQLGTSKNRVPFRAHSGGESNPLASVPSRARGYRGLPYPPVQRSQGPSFHAESWRFAPLTDGDASGPVPNSGLPSCAAMPCSGRYPSRSAHGRVGSDPCVPSCTMGAPLVTLATPTSTARPSPALPCPSWGPLAVSRKVPPWLGPGTAPPGRLEEFSGSAAESCVLICVVISAVLSGSSTRQTTKQPTCQRAKCLKSQGGTLCASMT